MTSLRNKTWRWIAVVLRIVLGVVFIYSAWAKLQEPWRIFAMDIEAYKLVTNLFWIEVIARGLPWFELLLGVWLISGFWLRGSATICAGLLTFFIGLMVWRRSTICRSIAAVSDREKRSRGSRNCATAACWRPRSCWRY